MSGPVQILGINTSGSDGDGRKWPKHTYKRNDQYYLEKLGEMWSKDLPGGPKPGVVYHLNRLPTGYAGFERERPDSKHVDRYIYGHQRGQFRSLNEFYPHFKHLMDQGRAYGCECKHCSNRNSSQPAPRHAKRVPTAVVESRPIRAVAHIDRSETQPKSQKRKLVDMEGTPDVYEVLIDKVKAAGPEAEIDEPIEERLSPDWRTGNELGKSLLKTWQGLPRFVPRIGEVVLFVRKLGDGHVIAWNDDDGAFHCYNPHQREWLDPPMWEAGVVTQMPEREISETDLLDDVKSNRSVIQTGFRVEPLSEIGSQRKLHTKQYTYVPLHKIRPFSLWSECCSALDQEHWHPTIKHALTVTNSVSLIGRYRFKGRWPQATIFCRGAYIGQELIMVGDTVKLLPRPSEQDPEVVTDVMLVTAIRLRFVNLDLEETEITTSPSSAPYHTCLHLSGRVFTLDSSRSFDGIGKMGTNPNSPALPPGISDYGQWYYYQDPTKPDGRIEIPFTRVLSRCPTDLATKIWFKDVADSNPEPSSRAGASAVARLNRPSFQYGLEGAGTAHEYSVTKDPRIKVSEGKSWFWADTRIEQLDLQEVNNRSVGAFDTMRSKGQMAKWRASLKAVDGKAGALSEYQAAERQEEQHETPKMQSSHGMVAASAKAESGVESSPGGEIVVDTDRVEDQEP